MTLLLENYEYIIILFMAGVCFYENPVLCIAIACVFSSLTTHNHEPLIDVEKVSILQAKHCNHLGSSVSHRFRHERGMLYNA